MEEMVSSDSDEPLPKGKRNSKIVKMVRWQKRMTWETECLFQINQHIQYAAGRCTVVLSACALFFIKICTGDAISGAK